MKCKHLRPIGLMQRRVTRVPNRRHGRMFTIECCGELQSISPSNDSSVGHEISLAACLQDACLLWEGKERKEIVERYVEGFASQPCAALEGKG